MPLSDPFYYLWNFRQMLCTLAHRDGDLLADEERGFMASFDGLTMHVQALLVRMVMRKGALFRRSRLKYAEIEDIPAAIQALVNLGWLDDRPALRLDDVFKLVTRADLIRFLRLPRHQHHVTKAALLVELRAVYPEMQTFDRWCGSGADGVVRLAVDLLCDRLRLLFFGNFRQNLTEFVLADLGVFRFERVELHEHSRPFRTRRNVEDFYRLYECRQQLQEGLPLEPIVAALPAAIDDCEWLQERREKLRFQIARAYERAGDVNEALAIYSNCSHREADLRARRLDDRANGRPERRRTRSGTTVPEFEVTLPKCTGQGAVERAVRDHLRDCTGTDTQVHYVENGLINSLFGLLCWRAVFAPLPGAFFHAFHHGPADLASAGFLQRRERHFAECFAELERSTYKQTMRALYVDKAGISSPFVAWGLLNDSLLDAALECFPATHLRRWFEWIVRDVRINRAGFPDLVQFWPRERRYRLVEVKGPGDRLQDNQRRCLEHCLEHAIPVAVCRVRWSAATALAG